MYFISYFIKTSSPLAMREKVIFSLCRIPFSSKHTPDIGAFLELAYLRSLGAHWFGNAWFDVHSIVPLSF